MAGYRNPKPSVDDVKIERGNEEYGSGLYA